MEPLRRTVACIKSDVSYYGKVLVILNYLVNIQNQNIAKQDEGAGAFRTLYEFFYTSISDCNIYISLAKILYLSTYIVLLYYLNVLYISSHIFQAFYVFYIKRVF